MRFDATSAQHAKLGVSFSLIEGGRRSVRAATGNGLA
jgi:hypothetical protein